MELALAGDNGVMVGTELFGEVSLKTTRQDPTVPSKPGNFLK